MSDPFLPAILAEPAEDAHRLVFADWLDENGQGERAEFICTQIELARLPEDDPRRADLEVREIQLLAKNAPEWAAPWPAFQNWEYAGDPPSRAVFRRGFVEVVEEWGSTEMLLVPEGQVTRMFGAHPVRELTGYGSLPRDLEVLSGWKGLRQIESLSLWRSSPPQFALQEIEPVLRSTNLGRLRKLSVRQFRSAEEAVRCLRLPVMSQLVALNDPSPHPANGRWLGELWRGDFPHLHELSLVTNDRPAYARAAGRLVRWDGWKQLTALAVYGSAPFPWSLALANAPLQRLWAVAGAGQGFTGLASALRSAPPGTLEELRLFGTFPGEELSYVLASPALVRLRRLTVEHAALSDDDLERLARSPALSHVRRLALRQQRAPGERGVGALFASPRLESLTHLTVGGGLLSPEAAAALAGNGACRRLRVLWPGAATSSAVLGALTGGEPFPDLHTIRLDFWQQPPDDRALEAFLDSPKLPRLSAVLIGVDSRHATRLGAVLQRCGRIAWAGGELGDGGDGVRVALKPDNVYLPHHLDGLGE